MNPSQAVTKTRPPGRRLGLLIGGDLLVLLATIWVGRISHAVSALDLTGALFTAAPFLISWFAITPWFGLFRADVSRNWRKLIPRMLLAWWVLGIPVAVILRALFLGRSIPGGIVPIFALVLLGATTLSMLAWRLGYIWWKSRSIQPLDEPSQES